MSPSDPRSAARDGLVRGARCALPLALALYGCAPADDAGIAAAARAADPTPEAYARSTAALMWPGATRAFQVTPEGDLYNGAWRVRVRPHDPAGGGTMDAPAPARIAFEDRWRPVAHWRRGGGAIDWSFEAFAWPADGDTNLYVSLVVRAANATAAPQRARLDVLLEPADSTAAFVAWDADTASAPPMFASRTSARDVAGFVPGAPRADGAAAVAFDWALPAKGAHSQRIVLSAYPRPARALAAFARVPHARRRASARAWWDAAVARGARFELGDPDAEQALAAARATLLACRERRNGAWFPIGGPFQYRDVWLRDGARAIRALALLGHAEEARALTNGIATLQWPWGAFTTQRGQPDGTGQALWAFEQALSFAPPSRDTLAAWSARAARAWRWCEATRRTMAGVDPRAGALMPFAEPRDNELARAPLTGTDAWTLAGYRAAARLAAAAGERALADSIEASRRAYAAGFSRAMREGVAADVPAAWRGTARDWGNVAAIGACRAGETLAGADSIDWTIRSAILAHRVLGDDGLARYGVADSLHGYLGADIGVWAMATGHRALADRALDALLRWRSASGGGAELFSRSSRDFGRNLPPHATCAAAVVELVRDAVLMDDGEALVLTAGARAAWWRGARVHLAPTQWGVLEIAFHREGDAAEWTWTPVPVATRLRLPPGTTAVSVAPPLAIASPGEVVAPPGTSQARVVLRAAGGAP